MKKKLEIIVYVDDENLEVRTTLSASGNKSWTETNDWMPEMDYILAMAVARAMKKISADAKKVDEEIKEKYAFYQFITRA